MPHSDPYTASLARENARLTDALRQIGDLNKVVATAIEHRHLATAAETAGLISDRIKVSLASSNVVSFAPQPQRRPVLVGLVPGLGDGR